MKHIAIALAAFITLTGADSGTQVQVNAEFIRYFYPHNDSQCRGTLIRVADANMCVRETPDQIMGQITRRSHGH